MRIFLVRHGFTFDKNQTAIMLGCNNDLPLVAKGREIAASFARYLCKRKKVPDAIYTNHLKRTSTHANIIKQGVSKEANKHIPIHYDDVLLEFDYGAWAGLATTNDNNQVIEQFGQSAWDAWQLERKIMNASPHNWQIKLDKFLIIAKNFFQKLLQEYHENSTIVLIGSQGSISSINHLLPGGMPLALSQNRQKINPGNFSELQLNAAGLHLVSWNITPTQKRE